MALRFEYQLRRIEGVEFTAGDIHRQYVTWDSGAEVWVNRGTSDWRVGKRTLPPYGFYARAPLEEGTVETAIERQGAGTVEWSRSPNSYYNEDDEDQSEIPRCARNDRLGEVITQTLKRHPSRNFKTW